MIWKHRLGKWLLPRLPVTRFVVEILRAESRSFVLAVKNRLLPWRRRRIGNIVRSSGLRLNIASGPHVLPDFVNLDAHATHPHIVEIDCRRSLPFRDASVEGIRVEHFVEHLEPREELPSFIGHCRRVLVRGGVLRIIVPDAERYLQAYCRGDLGGFRELGVPIPFPDDLPTRMDIVNHTFHQWHEHRWGYDFETLAHRLMESGFERVERTRFAHSLDPLLATDREEHSRYSLYVDAVR